MVLAIRHAVCLRAALAPLRPSSRADHGVKVAGDVSNARKAVPRATKADAAERPRAGSRHNPRLIEYKTSSSRVGGTLVGRDADTVLVGGDG